MSQVAKGQFTGAITSFKNQSIIVGIQPCINLATELAGNDEFANRAGTDDSTRDHLIQLIADCDKRRRMITYNDGGVDLKSVVSDIIDVDTAQSASLAPISMDHVQMSSTPNIELPWKLDGTDPNIPLMESLHMRNGIGAILYGAACSIVVQYTRLESAKRSHMLIVNDSLRMYSVMQTFRDLCDRLLGTDNMVDIAQPLATDEPSLDLAPNRVNSSTINMLGSN